MRRATLLLCLLGLLAGANVAMGAVPLSVGGAPGLDWGEREIDLQVGWPEQGLAVSWGTRIGWNNGFYTSLDLRDPVAAWGLGLTASRPFAHRQRTSLFFHFCGGMLLQRAHGGPTRFGGEGQLGLKLGIGLGAKRRAALEFGILPGMRVGPGLVALGPDLSVQGAAGMVIHLAADVSIALRGRAGVHGDVNGTPGLIWSAGASFTKRF